jgi:type II restriction enzyme
MKKAKSTKSRFKTKPLTKIQSQKILEATQILTEVGIPKSTTRRSERLAMTLLALANLKPSTQWCDASFLGDSRKFGLTTKKILGFWNTHYCEKMELGSYDDVQRKDLEILLPARIATKTAEGNNTNNPTNSYAISKDFSPVLLTFGTIDWGGSVAAFRDSVGSIADRIDRERDQVKVPIVLPNGLELLLSPGPHNLLQKAIVEEFLPRFVKEPTILYIGDTEKKKVFHEKEKLNELGFFELAHDSLPDVVVLDNKNQWIFLIEAVHSSNPFSKTRHYKIEERTKNCSLPIVYVSVFQNRKSLRPWILNLSWETEVWLSEEPSHMIHFNGDKFLGPHTQA